MPARTRSIYCYWHQARETSPTSRPHPCGGAQLDCEDVQRIRQQDHDAATWDRRLAPLTARLDAIIEALRHDSGSDYRPPTRPIPPPPPTYRPAGPIRGIET